MAMLDDSLVSQLSQLMGRLTRPVEFVVALDDRPESTQLNDLLHQVAELSDKITVRRDDGSSTRRPAFLITTPELPDLEMRFCGLPLGHEFNSFVLALLQVGGNPVKLDPDVVEAVRQVPGEHEFTTYMSLTCQNCPTVVQALDAMAVLNPRIKHTAVDGSLFRDEVNKLNILATPTMYLDGELFGQGRMDVADILKKMDVGTNAIAAGLNARPPYDVLVVGQGPAGVSAAIYLARKELRTGLVGDRFGGQVNDTMTIENFISVPRTTGPEFAARLEEHAGNYDIDVIKSQTATALMAPKQPGDLFRVRFNGDAELSARAVIVATGARWRHMNVPGEDDYANKGVTYCPHCDAPLFKGKPVAVIGGGNSGIEAAIDLAAVASHVTVLEFLPECKADDVLMSTLRKLPNVTTITNAAVTEVVGDGTQVTGLNYSDRISGDHRPLPVQGVFVQIGLLPNTEWVRDVVSLDNRGQIIIDELGQTSVPGVFAAGDCTTVPYKQIVVAQGSGATAALSTWNHLIRAESGASVVEGSPALAASSTSA